MPCQSDLARVVSPEVVVFQAMDQFTLPLIFPFLQRNFSSLSPLQGLCYISQLEVRHGGLQRATYFGHVWPMGIVKLSACPSMSHHLTATYRVPARYLLQLAFFRFEECLVRVERTLETLVGRGIQHSMLSWRLAQDSGSRSQNLADASWKHSFRCKGLGRAWNDHDYISPRELSRVGFISRS